MPRRRLRLPIPPRLALFFWLLGVPVGAAMAVQGGLDFGRAWGLWIGGVPGEAVVTAKSTKSFSRHSGWDRVRTVYYVSYRIDLPSGPVEQRHEVGHALFENLSAGDRISVRIDPGPPVVSEIEENRRIHSALTMLLGGVVISGTCLLVALVRIRRRG